MFQRILLPLDGSARAERVASVAARLAQHADGEILLLQITQDGASDPTQEYVAWAPRHADAAAYLTKVAKSEPLAGTRTKTIICEGDVVSGILSVARSSNADLIILSQERGAEPPGAPGRVAARVAREANLSVLLINPQQSPLARLQAAQPFALRLLVPLDGSPLAEAALFPAAVILDALSELSTHGSLHLAQIVASSASWRHAARYLARTAERIRAGALTGHPMRVTWSVIPHADPAAALIHLAAVGEDSDTTISWSVARDLGAEPVSTPGAPVDPGVTSAAPDTGFTRCDAIVMTTHGQSGLHHLLVGSVTERMIQMANMPLLLVRQAPQEIQPQALNAEPDVERWRL